MQNMPKDVQEMKAMISTLEAKALRETRQNRKQENTFNSEATTQEGEPSRIEARQALVWQPNQEL